MIAHFEASTLPTRVAIALVLSALIAVVAYRARALDLSGLVAAVAVGTSTLAFGGVLAGAALLAFFLSGSVLSRLPDRSTGSTSAADFGAKDAVRDAAQVYANGGVGAICAIAAGVMNVLHSALAISLLAACVAAFAAAAGDTWASEIGERFGLRPRTVVGLQPAPPGRSGAVTLAGTAASIAGGAVVGAAAAWVGGGAVLFGIATLAGFAGSLIDSLLGASVQGVWSCRVCNQLTELPTHHGERATLERGVRWVTNDMVNLFATLAAGALGFASGSLLMIT